MCHLCSTVHLVAPVQNLIFRFLQSRQKVQIWLYEQADLRIEGRIIVRRLFSTPPAPLPLPFMSSVLLMFPFPFQVLRMRPVPDRHRMQLLSHQN